MLCFQSVLYCIVLYNDVFTFLYVAVGNKLLLLLLLLLLLQFCNFYMHSRLCYSESDILSVTHVLGYNIVTFGSVLHTLL